MSFLTNKYRPQTFNEIIAQDHLVGPNGIISKMLLKKRLLPMIIFGPSGCGKTSIAKAIISELQASYLELNAINSNKKDIEQAIILSKMNQPFILIIDEIHRLNKDKQDILLPYVESGLITLIGLTNANPYHTINTALRSRTILLEVYQTTPTQLKEYLLNIAKTLSFKEHPQLEEIIDIIIRKSNLDIRSSLNQLELI
ncbi:MAG: AAA family ATPase, partial [Bacilli bacterium]